MKKIAVIYWSGTGNTEAMADLVAAAAADAGAAVDKFTAAEFQVSSAADYTGFALGCPAMGAEQRQARGVVRLLRLGRRRVDPHLGRGRRECRGASGG